MIKFQNDNKILEHALSVFKETSGLYVQEINQLSDGLVLGSLHKFNDEASLLRWLWKLSGFAMYIAVVSNEKKQELTFRGSEFVVAYTNFGLNPSVSYFRDFKKAQKNHLRSEEIKDSIFEINSILKQSA